MAGRASPLRREDRTARRACRRGSIRAPAQARAARPRAFPAPGGTSAHVWAPARGSAAAGARRQRVRGVLAFCTVRSVSGDADGVCVSVFFGVGTVDWETGRSFSMCISVHYKEKNRFRSFFTPGTRTISDTIRISTGMGIMCTTTGYAHEQHDMRGGV